jgi:hypothetical protein
VLFADYASFRHLYRCVQILAENLFASTTTDVSAGFYFSFTSSLHALIARRRDAFGSRQ